MRICLMACLMCLGLSQTAKSGFEFHIDTVGISNALANTMVTRDLVLRATDGDTLSDLTGARLNFTAAAGAGNTVIAGFVNDAAFSPIFSNAPVAITGGFRIDVGQAPAVSAVGNEVVIGQVQLDLGDVDNVTSFSFADTNGMTDGDVFGSGSFGANASMDSFVFGSQAVAVPEPGSVSVLALCMAAGFMRRRRS
ncbi:MAG: hypothetical protein Aurels2KO_26910 [Aureliella sp.]